MNIVISDAIGEEMYVRIDFVSYINKSKLYYYMYYKVMRSFWTLSKYQSVMFMHCVAAWLGVQWAQI